MGELDLFGAVVMLSLTSAATFYDYKTYKIPNVINAYGFLSGVLGYVLMAVFMDNGFDKPLIYILKVLMVVIVLYPAYMIGAIGAGDVKLLGVLSGFIGTEQIIKLIIASLLIGALYGVAVIIWKGGRGMHKIHFSYAILLAVIISIMQTKVIF